MAWPWMVNCGVIVDIICCGLSCITQYKAGNTYTDFITCSTVPPGATIFMLCQWQDFGLFICHCPLWTTSEVSVIWASLIQVDTVIGLSAPHKTRAQEAVCLFVSHSDTMLRNTMIGSPNSNKLLIKSLVASSHQMILGASEMLSTCWWTMTGEHRRWEPRFKAKRKVWCLYTAP